MNAAEPVVKTISPADPHCKLCGGAGTIGISICPCRRIINVYPPC